MQQKVLCGRGDHKRGYRARFENGVLKLLVPKKEAKKPEEEEREIHQHRGLMKTNGKEAKKPIKTGGVPLTSFPGYDIFERDLRLFYTDFTDILDFIKKE